MDSSGHFPDPARPNSKPLRFSSPESVQGWTAIDDRVMGGVSRSRLRYDAGGFAVFEGIVCLDNGGGFASVRHPKLPLGGAEVQGYRLSVRSDRRRYKFNLRTDSAFDAVQYQAQFELAPDTWLEVDLPVTAFEPRLRGRNVPGAPPLDTRAVCQVGLMIGDRQVGPFRLELRSIGLY